MKAVNMAFDGPCDVILMDIQMPVLDGYQAATLLRQRGFDRPILALTAHALAEQKAKAAALGFSGYICKPVNFLYLTQTLARLCSPPRH